MTVPARRCKNARGALANRLSAAVEIKSCRTVNGSADSVDVWPQRAEFLRRSVPEQRRAARVIGIPVPLPRARLKHSHRVQRTLAEPEGPPWIAAQVVRQ